PQSLQLFSGFRGSGKTTELFRLRKQLQMQGGAVLYANALEYVNPAEPVEISDLLMVLAGAFSDRLEELGISIAEESFWKRFTGYLERTTLNVAEAAASVEADSPAKEVLGGLKGGIELKLAVKETSSFRQKLRQFLQNRLGELKAEVDAFVEEGVKAIRNKLGEDTPIVFIFDNLEQLRGSISNEQEVIRSVERVFASHLDKLRLPYVHMIYTVPPWLKFLLLGAKVEILPTFRLWNNDEKRTRYPSGWDSMRKLVVRRLEPDGLTVLFGPEEGGQPLIDELIAASGGHFRDLFRLLQEMIVRVKTQTQSLPISAAVVESTVRRVREDYLPIPIEDALRLAEISKTRDCILAAASPQEAASTSRLLDLHLVLYFSNGGDWYDIHPLICDEVERIVKRSQRKRT
ncbi:MAG: hypothetical protein AB1813_07745, partial [Verrucomicrobiota bacterium]